MTIEDGAAKDGASADVTGDEPLGFPEDATRDRLIGDWYLYQRRGGHRTGTDDVITAWYAVHRQVATPEYYLDLGCGVGSVLLMVAHRVRPKVACGIEAQAQSIAMARRAVDELPAHECAFELRHGDFRDAELPHERYDLVTGSPPYFPLGTGVLPDDAQRRACRFETRGGVEAYAAAAAKAMTRGGRFYLVFQTVGRQRVVTAAAQYRLHLTGEAAFLMRDDRAAPFLTVFEFAKEPTSTPHHFRCAVRDRDGEISDDYGRVRRELGVERDPA